MTNLKDELEIKGDELMKAVAKSEVLTEDHDEIMEELEDSKEEIGNWITIIFKAIKEALI